MPFNGTGRFKGPPSRDDLHLSTEEEDLAYAVAFEHLSWEDATEQLYDFYSKTEDWAKAATVLEALCLEHPSEAAFCPLPAGRQAQRRTALSRLCHRQ